MTHSYSHTPVPTPHTSAPPIVRYRANVSETRSRRSASPTVPRQSIETSKENENATMLRTVDSSTQPRPSVPPIQLNIDTEGIYPNLSLSPDSPNITQHVDFLTLNDPVPQNKRSFNSAYHSTPNTNPFDNYSNHSASFKLQAPKKFSNGDDFSVFKLIFQNYSSGIKDVQYLKALLLSLIDTDLFSVAYPVVQKGQNINIVLNELQNIFSPIEEFSTTLLEFQNTTQHIGETVQQFSIRIAKVGRRAHTALPENQLQVYLVHQFLTGLVDPNIKNTVRMLGPTTLQQAVLMAKRANSQKTNHCEAAINKLSLDNDKISCQWCGKYGHIARECRSLLASKRTAFRPNSNFRRQEPSSINRSSTQQGRQFNNHNRRPNWGPVQIGFPQPKPIRPNWYPNKRRQFGSMHFNDYSYNKTTRKSFDRPQSGEEAWSSPTAPKNGEDRW